MPGGLAFDFSPWESRRGGGIADGEAYLVDAGEKDGAAADYLAKTGLDLRAVFLTHPHDDHIGGAGAVRALYPDATIYVPECWDRLEGVLEAQARSGLTAPSCPLARGTWCRLGQNAAARVLYPPAGITPADANDASLVLLITSGDASALLTVISRTQRCCRTFRMWISSKRPTTARSSRAPNSSAGLHAGRGAVSAGGGAGHPSKR